MPEPPRTEGLPASVSTPSARRAIVAATSEAVAVTYGALLGTEGVSTVLCPLNKLARALAGDVAAGCAVVVGTGDDLAAALEQVHALRSADSAAQRRTGIVLLASEELDQARAEAAEVDRVVVLPAHLRQIVDSIDAVLDRVADEAGQSFSKFSQ